MIPTLISISTLKWGVESVTLGGNRATSRMSRARDLFFSIPWIVPTGDSAALKILNESASEWREIGQHFSAGYCISTAKRAAWGTHQFLDYVTRAIEDYKNTVNSERPNSLASFAAIVKWMTELRYLDFPDIQKAFRSLREELAQRLITYFKDSQNADSYLVKGILATTDLDGWWEPSFPQVESTAGTYETILEGRLSISIPSAFQLLVWLADYQGAQSVVDRCPRAFQTPGLKGWKFAVRGFVAPGEDVELFTAAANAFAEDTPPAENELRSWLSINRDLWSSYFRARAAVARIPRERNRAHELLREASSALQGTEAGWVNPAVSRFRILINVLLHLLDSARGITPEQARNELVGEARLFGEDERDPIILQFIHTSAEAFDEFRTDPRAALTTGRLHFALEALARIPLIGPAVTEGITPAMGDRARLELLGPERTWIYRTLEAIADEAQLRKILSRLAQASLPLYAQIRHGPIEYGKDVVALLEVDGRRVLRMWQAKCGDMTIPKWNASRDELEQMFLVQVSKLQVGTAVDSLEGILVCNGHANPYVEPIMTSWFDEQKRAYGRNIEFMHLDRLVGWITNERLVNELRAALNELGIEPIIGSVL
jgi:hypothetical protein